MPGTRPASRSLHTAQMLGYPTSLAMDLDSRETAFDTFVWLWLTWPGSRWGGNFTNFDPNHVDASVIGAEPVQI